MTKIETYKNIWEGYLSDNYFPTFVRDIRKIEFSIFKNLVENDEKETKKLILDMLSGDVIILKNAIPKDVAEQIKTDLYDYGNITPESDFKTTYAIPNFHIKSKPRKGNRTDKKKGTRKYKVEDGYDEVGHSYYFYRWNEDELNIFGRVDEVWDTIKVFNGMDIDDYKKRLPKDKIIDQIQVIQYPINSGEITSHCDMSRWQKTNLTFSLTEKGKDFDTGGQYFLNDKEEKLFSESDVSVGDAPIFISTMFHGVDTPKSVNTDIDWRKLDGRWQLLATTIQSQCVENRVISYSLKNYKKNPKKVLEKYRQNNIGKL